MMMQTIHFVTSNASKFTEAQSILGKDIGFTLLHSQQELPELQGEFDQIVTHKCMQAAQHIKGAVLVDDAGIGFNALNGLPGPYTKPFLKKIGTAGLLEMLENCCNKSAQAICVLGYTTGPNQAIQLFHGIVDGKIITPLQHARTKEFGFDSIFQPNGSELSYSNMGLVKKNSTSHRYKALMLFKSFFANQT